MVNDAQICDLVSIDDYISDLIPRKRKAYQDALARIKQGIYPKFTLVAN